MKKYFAYTIIGFSVTTKSGKKVRVSFQEMSHDHSMYVTDDKELAEAIEKHPWFGDIFTLIEDTMSENKKEEKEDVIKEESSSLEEKKFTSASEAKEWLQEEYGVSANQIRTIAKMADFAESKGIKIVIE